jgi:toxin ParE1/3/4
MDVAERFLDAAEAAFNLLANMPEMGTLCGFQSSEAAGLRVWSIPGFENHLIFYRPIEGGIDVIRVIHGARDIPTILAEK